MKPDTENVCSKFITMLFFFSEFFGIHSPIPCAVSSLALPFYISLCYYTSSIHSLLFHSLSFLFLLRSHHRRKQKQLKLCQRLTKRSLLAREWGGGRKSAWPVRTGAEFRSQKSASETSSHPFLPQPLLLLLFYQQTNNS